ncbi:MAG TPA: ATP-binding protein [Verrucomicrobia bacterium]|nr:MAG: transcriptional regulator [Lentisphaerae bacterium GWF2_57_35]HBA84215.1 ATP-binding protein [Verrucomicrobiota bacterium]
MSLDLKNARKCLTDFDFSKLFIEELGWSQPVSRQTVAMTYKEAAFTRRQLAQLAGVMVLEITAQNGQIPDAKIRAALHKEISALHHENLLIFVDERRTQSLWYWVKRQDGKTSARDHIYVRGQPADLFLSKLNSMVFDISDFDEAGNVPLVEVADRLKEALDIERVTKKFYGEFQEQHLEFLNLIQGIDDERDRRWYASVLLNRLMFIYFLQRKLYLNDGDGRYLQNKLEQSCEQGQDRYYEKFLKALFFEGFAKPEDKRSAKINTLLGKIKYLNGGLFLHHRIELDWPDISVPDKAFANLFALFERYSWNLNDTPGGEANEINPDVLGYIFEKYINQKAFGAYYTRPEITEYLCERTIHRLILDGVANAGGKAARSFDSMGDLLLALDAPLCKKLLNDVLPNLRLLDPACGSAAFLVSAMKTLINVYSAVIGKIEFLSDHGLQDWLRKTQKEHRSVSYFIKRSIITNNLFGVDIMEEAIEIAKLRLFLALVASANSVDDLEPLPNIEFNIMAGNSLIGLMHVDDEEFEKRNPADFFRKSYRQILEEKNDAIGLYRVAQGCGTDMQELRDGIQAKKMEAIGTLNEILASEFTRLGIKYEQATWDEKKKDEGRPVKRALKISDIEALKPFHWGYEFDEILNRRGGFDAIITNPPWEIFKPNAKEFFEDFSDLVSKKNMTIKDFEKEQAKLLKDGDVRKAWLKYQSEYPHVSAFYRSASQYKNQISVVDGKKAGTDINLYKLFLEQCHNLLRAGGRCGIIIPSGVYTDLGTKQLREMLFGASGVDTLFGLSNEKFIFEAVHHAFKFCILSFAKGGQTEVFRAAFRINPREAVEPENLDDFLHAPENHLPMDVALIRQLAPDSISVMEFRNETDVQIAGRLMCFPPLKEAATWTLRLKNEFHMTNDSYLYHPEKKQARIPLVEGKLFQQFSSVLGEPKYWLDESEARAALLGGDDDEGQVLDYQRHRLAFRDVAAATNERCMIATLLPRRVFCPHTVSLEDVPASGLTPKQRFYLLSVLNSFAFDYTIRQKVTNHVSFFLVYATTVPRLTEKDAAFGPIVNRAARLICTTPEFDQLAKEVGLKSHKDGAIDPVERAKLRAELDGLIAHLYGLTEEEFAYILTTFPLVADPVKDAARNAYRDVERGLIK